MSAPEKQDRIAVAASGGADSLFSLISLKNQGYNIFALHALFLPETLRPSSYPAMLSALRESCARLGVELVVTDLSASFEAKVIRPFASAYMSGLTPNPCAGCNQSMKFSLLWDEAARLGAGRIVTGHYAKLLQMPDDIALLAADDASKDQSYFLSLTPLDSLRRAFFPLATLKKSEITAELERQGVNIPQKGESQEICFIPGNDYRAFLQNYLSLPAPEALKAQIAARDEQARAAKKAARKRGGKAPAPLSFPAPQQGPGELAQTYGPALLPDGTCVGTHYGLWNYTEGQRHGLGIAWKEPLFVLGKDIAANALLVGPKSSFSHSSCRCAQVNCLVNPDLWPETVLAKTRYRQALRPAKARLAIKDGTQILHLEFADSEPAPPAAPGQVAALYAPTPHGNRLLAGAVIL